MEYNPYTARYAAKKAEVLDIETDIRLREDLLIWCKSFAPDAVSSSLQTHRRDLRELANRLNDININVAKLTDHIKSLTEDLNRWRGIRYMFASKPEEKTRELNIQTQKRNEMFHQQQSVKDQISMWEEEIQSEQADLTRFRSVDQLEAVAAVRAKKPQLTTLKAQLKQLQALKEGADTLLKAPVDELMGLIQKNTALTSEIEKAEAFQQELSNGDSTERYSIHHRCGITFGDSSPARVIRARRYEIEKNERNIAKLRERLQALAARIVRSVNSLVIDGNNLCYEGDVLIGLVALKAVARKLSSKYKVLIVFDATICPLLRKNPRAIAEYLGLAIKFHIVAPDQKADETVLDIAAPSDSYVISNDRYCDFPEKQVIREKRIFRHEILNNRVLIHELNVDEHF